MSTLKVDTILKRTGTGTIVLGQSGDTISIPSGATLNSAGTNTLEGISNTPAFGVTLSGNQSLSDGSLTKVTWDTEVIDTDGAFASNKFTVPTGQDGKYFFYYKTAVDDLDDGEFMQLNLYIMSKQQPKDISAVIKEYLEAQAVFLEKQKELLKYIS